MQQTKVPGFASYEELAKVPKSHRWLWRRGPHIRILAYLVVLALFAVLKFLDSPFVRAYGLYILIVFAVGALVMILWRYFRRDPTEGVGIKLD